MGRACGTRRRSMVLTVCHRFHAWQSSLLFTAVFVVHILFSWSTVLSWLLFFGDIALMAWLATRAYRDADTLDRYELSTDFVRSLTDSVQIRGSYLQPDSKPSSRRRIKGAGAENSVPPSLVRRQKRRTFSHRWRVEMLHVLGLY